MKAQPRKDDYAQHVEHPRYGRGPRFTGLDPDTNCPTVRLHWNTGQIFGGQGSSMVRGTAIRADLSRQTPHALCAVTHYYDVDKVCKDCGRRFIFFAEEQKYWYEKLGFPLEADAVCCPACRKRLQHIARKRERYEQLCHVTSRSVEEALEMADCCLTLMEEAVFHPRQTERVKSLLKGVPEKNRSHRRFLGLKARLHSLEQTCSPQ